MYKYNGRVIHQSHDDDGIVEVVENDQVRSLHFGSIPRQSSMSLLYPDKLELDYVRAMTLAYLFKPLTDDEMLIIGLGGGSLAKHVLQQCPDCRLTIIEQRQSVVTIAHQFFALPADPRLTVIIDDAGRYLRLNAHACNERFSVISIDAFDHEGMAASINNKAFLSACHKVLKHDGILVINLWGGTSNPVFQQVALWLGQIFNWRILFLPVPGKGNIIGFAFNTGVVNYSFKALAEYAEQLAQHLHIDYPFYLKEIKRHNSSTLKQIIRS